MAYHHLPPGWRHYSEPEIIPPGESGGGEPDYSSWGRGPFEERSVHRIFLTKLGPFALLPYALLGGAIAIALITFLFGFLLILLPVAGLVLAFATIGSLLRGPRWRRW
jgi:hypothetical protein